MSREENVAGEEDELVSRPSPAGAATRPAPAPASRRTRVLLVVAVVVLAVNLRPALASVGPVLADLRADVGLTVTGAALLTTVPVLCLGALAPLAPQLARRLGLERALALVAGVVVAGLLLRVADGVAGLFAGTVVALGAVAVGNVLMPALIKRDFPDRTGTMMGVYTACLTGFAAVAAGITVPLGERLGLGWRGALGMWALPAALALLCWLPLTRRAEPPRSAPAAGTTRRLLRDPLAWQVTLFFGLQSLSFMAVLAWLPSIYREAGFGPAAAGLLLSASTLVQAPVSLVVPRLATRLADQRGLVAGSTALIAVGLAGVLVAPTAAPYLWVVVLGAGHGAVFALALILVVLRTRVNADTAALSAMAQTVGYVVAAAGPLLVGALRDATGSWTPSLLLLLGLLVPQLLVGLPAGRARVLREQ